MTDELHLEWTNARDSIVEINLGDTIEAITIRDALVAHAPSWVDIHAGPERGIPASADG